VTTIVFADALYWIALINARDQWHERAVSIQTILADSSIVTTESVLMEVANFFAEYGEVMRRKVALAIALSSQTSKWKWFQPTVRPLLMV
jgi:predicted nucleic acid-binding protein